MCLLVWLLLLQADLGAGGNIPSTDDIMRAIVQYNRRQLLLPDQGTPATAGRTSAASNAESGTQTPSIAAAADTALRAGLADQLGSSCEQPLLVVGYVMKASREEALASTHMLHLLPQEGMSFMPVDLDTLQQPHEQQHPDQDLQQQQRDVPFDILLHKGSDELIALPTASNSSDTTAAAAVDGGCSGPGAVGVCWSPRLVALQSWLAAHPQVCVVDPFEHTAKVGGLGGQGSSECKNTHRGPGTGGDVQGPRGVRAAKVCGAGL